MAVTIQEQAILAEAAAIIKRECSVAGTRVLIREFGIFRRVTRAAYQARDPLSGNKVNVVAKSRLRFTPSKSMTRVME